MYQSGSTRPQVIYELLLLGMPAELAEQIADTAQEVGEQASAFSEGRGLTPQAIIDFTSRLPYSGTDMAVLKDHLSTARRNGLDIAVKPGVDLEQMMSKGVLVLQSEALHLDICFVKVDAGRGFFGWQKSNVLTYVSDINAKSYKAGPVLGGLLRALTGINNIYREAGLLVGVAL
jgi:hypothetical protein